MKEGIMMAFTKVWLRLVIVFSGVVVGLVLLTATGFAQSGGTIATNPTSINFGNAFEQIHQVNADVGIQNTGSTNLVVQELQITGGNASDFSLLFTAWPFTLAPGRSLTLTVIFAPSSPGVKNALLRISSNAQNASTRDVPLTGNSLSLSAAGRVTAEAVASAINPVPGAQVTVDINIDMRSATPPANTLMLYQATLAWNPTVLQYLGYAAGDAPWRSPTSIDQSKINSGSLEWVDYDFTGTSNKSKVIQLRFKVIGTPNTSTLVNLEFKRLVGTDVEGLIRILSNVDTTIKSSGNNTSPAIVVAPTALTYGTVPIGSNLAQTVVVKNVGAATLNVSSMSISGFQANQFAIVSGGAPFTLAAGASRNVSVRFAPTSQGQKSGSLVLTSNDPDESRYTVALVGAASGPEITVTPTALNFGNVKLGSFVRKSIIVRNDGTSTLYLNLYSIEGQQNEWGFNAGISPLVSPGQSKTIQLNYGVTKEGVSNAKFVMVTNDPDEIVVEVTLTGTGVRSTTARSSEDPADEVAAEYIATSFLATEYATAEYATTNDVTTGDNTSNDTTVNDVAADESAVEQPAAGSEGTEQVHSVYLPMIQVDDQ